MANTDSALPAWDASVVTPAATALMDAVLHALRMDAGLLHYLGGPRVHDVRPPRMALPFVTLGETASTAVSGDLNTAVHRFVVHAWSQKDDRGELNAILRMVVAALDDQPLTLAGHVLVSLRWITSATPASPLAADHRTWSGFARFRAVTEPATQPVTQGDTP